MFPLLNVLLKKVLITSTPGHLSQFFFFFLPVEVGTAALYSAFWSSPVGAVQGLRRLFCSTWASAGSILL